MTGRNRARKPARGAASAAASARFANLDKALRMLRESQGFSQAELAAALGVAVSTVSSWERGARVPSLPVLAALAERLDLDLGDLDRALDHVNGRLRPAPRRDPAVSIDLHQVARRLAGGGGALGSEEETAVLHLLEAVERIFGAREGGPRPARRRPGPGRAGRG